MRLREVRKLVRISRPSAPYGVRRLARASSIDDLARLAQRRLPGAAMGYLDGGGEDERTLRRNRAALDEVELVPRVPHDVSTVDTATSLLGVASPVPFALAPVGAPRLFHHEGELAVARAARRARVPYGISTLATQPIDDITAASNGGVLWFQLYLWGDRGIAKELIGRAAALGYRALVISVDTSVRSKRRTSSSTMRRAACTARCRRWSTSRRSAAAMRWPSTSEAVRRRTTETSTRRQRRTSSVRR